MSDHARYRDDVGAYLLGALNELERQAFERHLTGCSECQEELERLRPAAEALPGSVVQLQPPPGLKRRLMAEVEGEVAYSVGGKLAPHQMKARLRHYGMDKFLLSSRGFHWINETPYNQFGPRTEPPPKIPPPPKRP